MPDAHVLVICHERFLAAQTVSLFGALLYADVKLVVSWVVLCPALLQTAFQLHEVGITLSGGASQFGVANCAFFCWASPWQPINCIDKLSK